MSSWRLFVRYSSYVLAWWNLYVMLHLMILLGYQPYDSLIYLPYYITSEYVIPFPLFHCAVFLFSELSDQSCLKFLHYLKFSNFFILEGKHTRFDFQVIETSKLPPNSLITFTRLLFFDNQVSHQVLLSLLCMKLVLLLLHSFGWHVLCSLHVMYSASLISTSYLIQCCMDYVPCLVSLIHNLLFYTKLWTWILG